MRELGERTAEISTRDPQPVAPAPLVEAGDARLAAAVRGHCREAAGARASTCEFRDENVPAALPHDVELCLFRIVQEGLNNVVKHSGAREAHVTLSGTGERCC